MSESERKVGIKKLIPIVNEHTGSSNKKPDFPPKKKVFV